MQGQTRDSLPFALPANLTGTMFIFDLNHPACGHERFPDDCYSTSEQPEAQSRFPA